MKVDAYLQAVYRARPHDEAVQVHETFFALDDHAFAELLSVWFEVHERLRPVIGMLLGQRYMTRSLVENRLITAVAAAEGLHRRLLADENCLPASSSRR